MRRARPGALTAGIGRPLLAGIAVVALVAILYPLIHDSAGDKVRDRVDAFAGAMRAKEYEAVCDEHLAGELKARVELAGGCASVMRRSAARAPGRRFEFEVDSVEIDGDRATARVDTGRSKTTVPLVKEDDGEWRLAGFG